MNSVGFLFCNDGSDEYTNKDAFIWGLSMGAKITMGTTLLLNGLVVIFSKHVFHQPEIAPQLIGRIIPVSVSATNGLISFFFCCFEICDLDKYPQAIGAGYLISTALVLPTIQYIFLTAVKC